MGFMTSPEFWGAIVVAVLGYLVILVRTAITQQQTLALERMRESIDSEIEALFKGYDRQLWVLSREIRELKELRRQDNQELARLLGEIPNGPKSSDLCNFGSHPYLPNEERIG